jgi:hypothetical protein
MMNRPDNQSKIISQQMYSQQPQRTLMQPRPPIAQPDMTKNIHALLGKLILGMVVFVGLILVLMMVAANFRDFARGSDGVLNFVLQWLPVGIMMLVGSVVLKFCKKELLQVIEYTVNKVAFLGTQRDMAKAKVRHVEATIKHIEARADNSRLEALSHYEIALAQAKERAARAWQLGHSLPVSSNFNSAIYVDDNGIPGLLSGPQPELPAGIHSLTYHNAPRIQGQTKVTEEAAQLSALNFHVPTGRELLMDGTVKKWLAEGRIILGVQENGQIATLKIKKCFSTLVSGLPGVGKTTTVFWIVGQLVIVGARLWIVDPHINFQDDEGNRSLATELADLAESFVFEPCDDTPEHVIYRVRFMYKELMRRQESGYIVRAKDMIIGIMDEFNSIADSIDPSTTIVEHKGRDLNFAQTLALLEREGRKFGLHFMLIGHKWARQDIGGDNAVRTNATTYLCHKMNDERQANLLLAGQAKKVIELLVGQYWITGPSWNEKITKIITPMISAVDLPILRQIKSRGVEVLKQENVVDSTLSEGISGGVSEGISTSYPNQTQKLSPGYNTGKLVKPVDTNGDDSILSPDLRSKLELVLDMDAHEERQNEIIKSVWGVDPSTRQGRQAAEELRKIRAYLAYQNRRRLRADRRANCEVQS